MFPSVLVSIDDARQKRMVGKIERQWRVNQKRRNVLSPSTINKVIADWKKDKFVLIVQL